MPTDPNLPEVIHNPEANRFEIRIGDHLAMIEYMQAGNNVIFNHTEVPEELEGQGLASRMARVALDWARNSGFKIQALCPFVAGYIRKHPEYQPITWGYEP